MTESLSFWWSFFSRFDTAILETPNALPISSCTEVDQQPLFVVQLLNGLLQTFQPEVPAWGKIFLQGQA